MTGFSQEKANLIFIPLLPFDTLSETDMLQEIQKENDFQSDNFIIGNWTDKTGTYDKALFCKKEKQWLVYKIPNDENYGIFELSDNSRFLIYTTYNMSNSRSHSESKGQYHIIDLKKLTTLSLIINLATEDWNPIEDTPSIESSCNSSITLKGNTLSVKKLSKNAAGCESYFDEKCLPTGTYKIEKGKLVKQ